MRRMGGYLVVDEERVKYGELQFDTESKDIYLELEKLKERGYSVYYFFTGKGYDLQVIK